MAVYQTTNHNTVARQATILLVCVASLTGCASKNATPPSTTQRTQRIDSTRSSHPSAILYHRTGGIAGTDDRVVIWPDGLVQVRGKILTPGEGWLSHDSMQQLGEMITHFDSYRSEYRPAQPIEDAYLITISIGGKTVEAWDLAPDLPPDLRKLIDTIEKVAGDIGTEPTDRAGVNGAP